MTKKMEQRTSLPPQTKAGKAQTKAGKIRALMPEIERRMADGVTRVGIIEWLAEREIEVTRATLKSYLQRYRQGTRSQSQLAPTLPQTIPALENTDRNTGTDPEPITDGNPDGETRMPEPDSEAQPERSFEDSIDPKKRGAYADQFMNRQPKLIGRKRSEK
jgi:hypothetical protein